MISPLPGVTHGKPGSAMIPIPGVSAEVVTEEGEAVPNGSGGYLVLTEPWPSMLRTIWGDDERFKDTYWSKYAEQGFYFAGDGAKKDDDGDLWVLGRVDDVMNVSGHRLSTTEIESADRKSTRLNSSHMSISYAVFCLKKKKSSSPATRAHIRL